MMYDMEKEALVINLESSFPRKPQVILKGVISCFYDFSLCFRLFYAIYIHVLHLVS